MCFKDNLIDVIVSESIDRAEAHSERREEQKQTPTYVMEQVSGLQKMAALSLPLSSVMKRAVYFSHNLPVVQPSFAQQLFVRRFVSLLPLQF